MEFLCVNVIWFGFSLLGRSVCSASFSNQWFGSNEVPAVQLWVPFEVVTGGISHLCTAQPPTVGRTGAFPIWDTFANIAEGSGVSACWTSSAWSLPGMMDPQTLNFLLGTFVQAQEAALCLASLEPCPWRRPDDYRHFSISSNLTQHPKRTRQVPVTWMFLPYLSFSNGREWKIKPKMAWGCNLRSHHGSLCRFRDACTVHASLPASSACISCLRP